MHVYGYIYFFLQKKKKLIYFLMYMLYIYVYVYDLWDGKAGNGETGNDVGPQKLEGVIRPHERQGRKTEDPEGIS